jgi:hypothetical protein
MPGGSGRWWPAMLNDASRPVATTPRMNLERNAYDPGRRGLVPPGPAMERLIS